MYFTEDLLGLGTGHLYMILMLSCIVNRPIIHWIVTDQHFYSWESGGMQMLGFFLRTAVFKISCCHETGQGKDLHASGKILYNLFLVFVMTKSWITFRNVNRNNKFKTSAVQKEQVSRCCKFQFFRESHIFSGWIFKEILIGKCPWS